MCPVPPYRVRRAGAGDSGQFHVREAVAQIVRLQLVVGPSGGRVIMF
jgi:hypothetical protein